MKIPSWVCHACNIPTVPWRTLGLLLAVILVAAFTWNRNHKALLDAQRSAEAAQLALKGQIVAEQESKGELQKDMSSLLEQNDLLKLAYEEALKAAPDAVPESSASLQTESVYIPTTAPSRMPLVYGPAVHPPALEPCDRPYKPNGQGGFTCPKPEVVCVLAAGDSGHIRVDEILLKTDKGNSLVTGVAEFWRDLPEPKAKLAAGKFSAALSHVDALAPPVEPRWGAEAIGACTKDGCGFGAGVLLPPVRFLGLRWEGRAGAVFSGPAAGAQGGFGARW